VTTVFQISIYCLVCLASLILAAAEGATFPTGLTVPLALSALFVTERWKAIRLPAIWANALGFLAFGLATAEFLTGDIEARLVSGAHLLVYLTWIIIFLESNLGSTGGYAC